MDVHMMVSEPAKWIADVAKAVGAAEGRPAQFTFHIEATDNPKGVIEMVRGTPLHHRHEAHCGGSHNPRRGFRSVRQA